MANKALATRQRMQFRVEPSQAPARLRNPALHTGAQTDKKPGVVARSGHPLLSKLLASAKQSEPDK